MFAQKVATLLHSPTTQRLKRDSTSAEVEKAADECGTSDRQTPLDRFAVNSTTQARSQHGILGVGVATLQRLRNTPDGDFPSRWGALPEIPSLVSP